MECAQRQARLQTVLRRTSDRISFLHDCVSFYLNASGLILEFSVHFKSSLSCQYTRRGFGIYNYLIVAVM